MKTTVKKQPQKRAKNRTKKQAKVNQKEAFAKRKTKSPKCPMCQGKTKWDGWTKAFNPKHRYECLECGQGFTMGGKKERSYSSEVKGISILLSLLGVSHVLISEIFGPSAACIGLWATEISKILKCNRNFEQLEVMLVDSSHFFCLDLMECKNCDFIALSLKGNWGRIYYVSRDKQLLERLNMDEHGLKKSDIFAPHRKPVDAKMVKEYEGGNEYGELENGEIGNW